MMRIYLIQIFSLNMLFLLIILKAIYAKEHLIMTSYFMDFLLNIF